MSTQNSTAGSQATTAYSYEVKFEQISIANSDYQIRSLKDRQQYFDPMGYAENVGISSATWPLFGVVWPSAVILARVLAAMTLDKLEVLEVGAGIALPSLVACRMGAHSTVSDYHPLARAFLLKNTELNSLPEIAYLNGDWRAPEVGLVKFDLIIGSDLLYERDHPEQLSAFLHFHASLHTKIIIVDPGRKHANKFSRLMRKLGYSVEEQSVPVQWIQGTEYKKGKVLVYQQCLVLA